MTLPDCKPTRNSEEPRFYIDPIVVGEGPRLLTEDADPTSFELTDERKLPNDVRYVAYRPVSRAQRSSAGRTGKFDSTIALGTLARLHSWSRRELGLGDIAEHQLCLTPPIRMVSSERKQRTSPSASKQDHLNDSRRPGTWAFRRNGVARPNPNRPAGRKVSPRPTTRLATR